jgi:hypothetical protein
MHCGLYKLRSLAWSCFLHGDIAVFKAHLYFILHCIYEFTARCVGYGEADTVPEVCGGIISAMLNPGSRRIAVSRLQESQATEQPRIVKRELLMQGLDWKIVSRNIH